MIFLLAISSVAFGQVQIPMWTTEKEQLENEKKEREAQQQAQQRAQQEQQKLKELEPVRTKAQNDVVAQALNYVSGYGEDAKGENFYYPVERNNGNCIFKSTEKGADIVDLNKGNPSAIQFSTQRGFMNVTVYISSIEGLRPFGCYECNGDRVQRAWALIYKQCKGNRKAF